MRDGFHQKMLIVVQQKTYIFFCPPFFCHIFLQKLVTLGILPADKMSALRSPPITEVLHPKAHSRKKFVAFVDGLNIVPSDCGFR